MAETVSTVPPEVQRMSPDTVSPVLPENTASDGLRGVRVAAMESVSGIDQNGNKRVGQIFRDSVQDRLLHPEDTTKTRVLARRHIFTELNGAAKGVDQILTAHSAEPIDNATLAKLLRPRVEAVYLNRKGGKEALEILTDEEVIADAKDFSGTVARELFLGEYLNRVNKEMSVKGEIAELCNQNPDVRINRGSLFKKVRQFMKARTRTGREIGRVSNRLKLGEEEKRNLTDAVKAHYPRSAAEYIQDENAVVREAATIKSTREKKIIQDVTGDTEDPALHTSDIPLENTRHATTLENIRKHEDAFSDVADAQAEYLSRRHHLADACQSLNPGLIVKAFNGMRQTELAYKVAQNSVKTIQRREARRFRLLSIAEDGKKQLETTTGILLGSPAGSLAKSVVAEAQSLPGNMVQGTKNRLESMGHTSTEMRDRPAQALARGVTRVTQYVNSSVEAQVDRVIGFARNVKKEFYAWKGQPDIYGKMARSAAYFSYGNNGDISGMQAIQAEIAAAEQEAASTSADTSLPVTESDQTAVQEASPPAAPVQELEDSSADVSAAEEQPEEHSQANEQKHRFSLPFSFRNPFRRHGEQKNQLQKNEEENTQPSEKTEVSPELSDTIDPSILPPEPEITSRPQPVEENQTLETAVSSAEDRNTPDELEQTSAEKTDTSLSATPVVSEPVEQSSELISDEDLAEKYWKRFEGGSNTPDQLRDQMRDVLRFALEGGSGVLEVTWPASEINEFSKERHAAFKELAKEQSIDIGDLQLDSEVGRLTANITKSEGEEENKQEVVIPLEPVQVESAVPTLEHPPEHSSESQAELAEAPDEELPALTSIPTGESTLEASEHSEEPDTPTPEPNEEIATSEVVSQEQSQPEVPADTVTNEIAQAGEEVAPQQESGERRKKLEMEMYNELISSALGRSIVVLNEMKAAPESLAKVEEALRILESQEVRQRVESEGLTTVLRDSHFAPIFMEIAETLREHAKTIKSTDYKKNDRIAANLLGGLALVGLENT